MNKIFLMALLGLSLGLQCMEDAPAEQKKASAAQGKKAFVPYIHVVDPALGFMGLYEVPDVNTIGFLKVHQRGLYNSGKYKKGTPEFDQLRICFPSR